MDFNPMSNNAILRKQVPFKGYNSEILYSIEFWGKFEKYHCFNGEIFGHWGRVVTKI